MHDHAMRLIDLGTAEEIYVSGLARVTPIGNDALFTFYVLRPRLESEELERYVVVKLRAPVEAVGPAFDLAINTLGPRAMATLAGAAICTTVKRVLLS